MPTTRSIRDQVQNALDYLVQADLALFLNQVSLDATRVSWHRHTKAPFLESRSHPGVDQYLAWLKAGDYSALLFDGSLVQITYDVEATQVTGHRLAYFPCPYDLDSSLLDQGEAVADLVDLYRGGDSALRSPLRFDFDRSVDRTDHPAAHLTLNSSDCRIGCVAPVSVLRFLDFIFSNFYPSLRHAHATFFSESRWQHLGGWRLGDERRSVPHMAWNTHATQSEVSAAIQVEEERDRERTTNRRQRDRVRQVR